MSCSIKELAVGTAIIGCFTFVMAIPHPEDVKARDISFKECVNDVAYKAYVEDDVGDDFDSGFDAGLVAYELCSKDYPAL